MPKKSGKSESPNVIRIRGARQHNLKNLDLDLPVGELTVITGPSGSGKSSLAFHTLYAEGQRRYVETFSPYVRQFFDRMDKPEVDRIDGIPPAIAIEQKNTIRTTRSTVGTLTEVNDYLKLLYPRLATGYHPDTGKVIQPDTPASILHWCLENLSDQTILILFSIPIPAETAPEDLFPFLNNQGYLRILLDREVTRTDQVPDLKKLPRKIQVIQDRIKVTTRNQSRLTEAFENALRFGKGTCHIGDATNPGKPRETFTTSWHPLVKPTSSLFSFNSPLGACDNCRGFGRVIGLDLDKAVPNHLLSLREGAIKPFQGERGADCQRDLLKNCRSVDIDPSLPWNELTPDQQHWVKYGERKKSSTRTSLEQSEALWDEGRWYGIQGFFDWMETKAYKMHVRVFLSRYRAYTICPECQGSRLQSQALNFKILDKALPDLWHLPIDELTHFFEQVAKEHSPLEKSSQLVLTEIQSRLDYLVKVGLGYLTLDRPARTLSGGEIARVNLTTCLGSALTHTLFVLDEPTVGLHHRDIHRLTEVMHALRDKGNTLVVVEHDEAVMREADNLIDIGPAAGEGGGTIVANLSRRQINSAASGKKNPDSTTLPFLLGSQSISIPKKLRSPKANLHIRRASVHNIHNLSLDLPLGTFVALTGVSGSGKSSLAHPIIYNNLARHFGLAIDDEPAPAEITNVNELNGIQLIDQSPLSRTPRSTPAVLLGAFEHIRQLFALTPAARNQKLTPGYFSFNSGPGRCQRCSGNGFEKVEMQFLSDLFLTCPECHGSRFTLAAREFKLHGKSITDVLNLTTTEALDFLSEIEPANNREKLLLGKATFALRPLVDTGLGYLRLGQPLNTLSGGEAQRLKLCQLLTSTEGSINTLLILDEPTTGLHFIDIERLLVIFHRLVDAGYSLLVIEHQTDVIKNADHVIEIGPEAGSKGGKIVFEGPPRKLAKRKTHTGQALAQTSIPAPAFPRKKVPANRNISISGLRHHNLKNLTLDIPRHEFVVISGLSGSGKSTLAFDVLFSEGQRRFLDSMSPYARQFASQLEKPDLDLITGLPPTVAIEQRISRGGGKSTVGTVTEIYHFLRLLFAKVGVQHCPQSGEPVVSQTPEAIGLQLGKLLKKHKSFRLLAPVLKARKGFHKEYAEAAAKAGFEEMFIDNELVPTAEFQPLARHKAHDIDFVIDRLSNKQSKTTVSEAIATALQYGKGTFRILTSKGELHTFSTSRVSPVTGESFEELDPHHFSFNSPRGWCSTCRGYGYVTKTRFDSKGFNSEAEAEIQEEKSRTKADPDEAVACPDCHGARLRENSRHVFIAGQSLPHLTSLNVREAHQTIRSLQFSGRDLSITRDIVPEITQRLEFLDHVGLGYLQLDRSATTLSGGESQRIRLAAQLGSNLQGVLYILDEPTIGLHPRDNSALLGTLQALKDKGNSLVLVEHDEDTIRAATHLIDLGPGAGVEGGQVVAETSGRLASKTNLKKFPNSPTLQALTNPLVHPSRGRRRKILKAKKNWLELKGCTLNNLNKLDVRIPLGRLTVLTGVSGSGKSSLMRGCLSIACEKNPKNPPYTKATGFDHFKYRYEVDQSPIGKTSRSCPATYVKLFDHIRALFAQLPDARMRGYTASRFSFNNKEGQCPECKGNGRIKLEMDFLPTTWIDCEACDGERYNDATLEIRYNGLNIGEILQLNITSAAQFFEAHPKLQKPLQLLADTGLGYLTLGQPSPTLSGGEAQRLKLVTQLTKGRPKITDLGPTNTNLYLIEEPTIGLHQQDVAKLTDVLHRLVDEGHTVVVIEHHMDLAAEADHIIDLGPEAGPRGGKIVAQGTPEEVAKSGNSVTAPFLAGLLQ